MEQDTTKSSHLSMGSRDVLTEILRHGAQEMLATAIENEVAEYLAAYADQRDAAGHRLYSLHLPHLPRQGEGG